MGWAEVLSEKVAVTVTEGSWLWSLLGWLLLSSMHHGIFPPVASQAYPGGLLGLTWVIPLDSIDEDSQPQGVLGYLCPGIIISLTWPKFPHDNAVVWRYPKCSFCLCCYVHFFSTDISPTNFYVLWIFKSFQNFTHQRPNKDLLVGAYSQEGKCKHQRAKWRGGLSSLQEANFPSSVTLDLHKSLQLPLSGDTRMTPPISSRWVLLTTTNFLPRV